MALGGYPPRAPTDPYVDRLPGAGGAFTRNLCCPVRICGSPGRVTAQGRPAITGFAVQLITMKETRLGVMTATSVLKMAASFVPFVKAS